MSSLQAIRGMNDVLPDQIAAWQHIESVLRASFAAYAYEEIRFPVLEKTELFARSIGADTDIVAKEMYTFEDRNGDSVTLRPEGTASCVRAGLEHGLFHNQSRRLWYLGPMFRHERPQRGRYRQFHQAGAEAFGWAGPDIDAELIALTAGIWRRLSMKQPLLQLNSLGDGETRRRYQQELVDYLSRYENDLDADSQRRMSTNPLRILDSKNETTRAILEAAPDLLDTLDGPSREHFDRLCEILSEIGIEYEINSRLVRGLDYYSRTVFEWVSDSLGAQATVCAGGRYDGLVQHLGGKRGVPAAGFALGLERLVEIVSQTGATAADQAVHVYLVSLGDAARGPALALAERLRAVGYRVHCHCGEGGLKSQLRKADKSGAAFALLLGEEEVAAATVSVKPLRGDGAQISWPQDRLIEQLDELLPATGQLDT